VEAAGDPDLLWALRGAGANFGVVTRLDLAVHRIGLRIAGGVLAFPADGAGEVLSRYAELAGTAPRELGTIVNLRHAPPAPWLPLGLHGRPVVLIGVCWTGTDAGLDRLLAPLRALRPLADTVGAVPYTEHQRLFDAAVPHGLHYFWRSDYVTGLGGEIAEALGEYSWSMRNRRSYTIMFHLGGAPADLDPGTAGRRRWPGAAGPGRRLRACLPSASRPRGRRARCRVCFRQVVEADMPGGFLPEVARPAARR
jgi:hypothetical protein